MFLPIWKKLKYMLLILVLSKEASVLKAAQISSESDKDWINQAIRFWTFQILPFKSLPWEQFSLGSTVDLWVVMLSVEDYLCLGTLCRMQFSPELPSVLCSANLRMKQC